MVSCRVKGWRAYIRVRWRFRRFHAGPQSGSHRHVSSPCSPNPACRFPAPGSPVGSCVSHTSVLPMRTAVARHLAGIALGVTRPQPTVAPRFRLAIEPVDASMAPDPLMVNDPLSGSGSSLMHAMPSGISGRIRGNRHCHSHGPAPFQHPSSPEAPSLGQRYPASSVVRASPPPRPARPAPRGGPVRACHATDGASRVASIPLLHACRRQYPGGTGRCSHRSLPGRWQPSPYYRRVGFRITRFEACSAFTVLRPACSLSRPWRPVSSECFRRTRYLLRPLRLLPAGATVAGRDSHPLRNGAFPRRTAKPG